MNPLCDKPYGSECTTKLNASFQSGRPLGLAAAQKLGRQEKHVGQRENDRPNHAESLRPCGRRKQLRCPPLKKEHGQERDHRRAYGRQYRGPHVGRPFGDVLTAFGEVDDLARSAIGVGHYSRVFVAMIGEVLIDVLQHDNAHIDHRSNCHGNTGQPHDVAWKLECLHAGECEHDRQR